MTCNTDKYIFILLLSWQVYNVIVCLIYTCVQLFHKEWFIVRHL